MTESMAVMCLLFGVCAELEGAQIPKEPKGVGIIESLAAKIVRNERLPAKPVVELHLHGEDVTDETLSQLTAYRDLVLLNLSCASITDAGLVHLKQLRNLKVLYLDWVPLTERGVEHINGIGHLNTLSLFATGISKDALGQLIQLKQLRKLRIDREQHYEEAIKALRNACPQLTIDQGNGSSAEKRARKHFRVADSVGVDQVTLQSAILQSLPLGATESQVYSFLKSSNIGKDKLSSFHQLDTGRIICRIDLDPEDGWIVHTHYGIFFWIDAEKGLDKIEVKEWITGP